MTSGAMTVPLLDLPVPDIAPLVERLKVCAQLWTEANSASRARLGSIVVNDPGFFTRVEATASTTTKTLERFARFLGDPKQWPDQAVPAEVCIFVHVVGVLPNALAESPDIAAGSIGAVTRGEESAHVD